MPAVRVMFRARSSFTAELLRGNLPFHWSSVSIALQRSGVRFPSAPPAQYRRKSPTFLARFRLLGNFFLRCKSGECKWNKRFDLGNDSLDHGPRLRQIVGSVGGVER